MTASTSPGGQDKTPTNAALPEGEGGLPARFGRNVFMNYFAQGLTALSAAVLTPILLHHLGKSTYGLWVVASGAVAYLELFELGFGGATTKLISEDADVRPELALRTLNTNFFVLVPLGLIALAVGVGLSFAMPHLVHVSPDQRDGFIVVVFLLGLGLATSIPGDSFGGALVGHQRYDLLAASNATMTVATTVAGILVVLAGGGVVLLALVTSAISILTHLLRLSMVRAIMPGTRISPRLIDRGQRRHALRVSGWFLLGAVLSAIYATGDVMIVGIVLGLRDAAIYAVGSKLAAATINGLDAMAQVFFPHASSAARNREPGALGEITIDGTRVTFGAGLMVSLALIVLAGPGVRAWVGPGFGTSAQVLLVLAIATALASPVRAMGNILIGAGRYPLAAAIRGGEVTVNIALSVTLGLVMGPVGVAVGTLGGILLVRLPTQLVAGCRATGVHTWTFVQRALLPNVVPAIGCTASLFVLRLVPLQSLAWVVLEAILACMVYLVLFFLTATSPAERRRTMAFVTRPLPARWRSAVEVSSPAATVDEAP
jgi:O-antigen/teichoic acid export membrane protein